MSNIKVGSKMLYCKVAGDKSTEEVVEVVGIQSDANGGGVTIYIPSLKRERDTDLSRLSEIVEKKEKLDTFFGKPKLVLPEFPKKFKMSVPGGKCLADGTKPIAFDVNVSNNWTFSADYTFYSHNGTSHMFGMDGGNNLIIRPYGDSFYAGGDRFGGNQHGFSAVIKIGVPVKFTVTCAKEDSTYVFVLYIDGIEQARYRTTKFVPSQKIRIGSAFHAPSEGLDALVENIEFNYDVIPPIDPIVTCLHSRDNVLLDNQRLLFNQLNSLKESLKVLSQKEKKQTADDTAALSAEIKELRNLNTSLLLNQQVMAKEMQQMKAQMELMMRYMPTAEAIAVPIPVKTHHY
jgi:hypothetical protein